MTDSIDEAIQSADEPERIAGDIVLRKHAGSDTRRVGFNMPADLTTDDLFELVALVALYMPKFLEAYRQKQRGGIVIAKTMPGVPH